MIYVMLRCNIIPEFRARCPDMDPLPQRVPTSPRREASLLDLPGLNGPGNFLVCYGSGVTMGSQAFGPNRRVLALSGVAPAPVAASLAPLAAGGPAPVRRGRI